MQWGKCEQTVLVPSPMFSGKDPSVTVEEPIASFLLSLKPKGVSTWCSWDYWAQGGFGSGDAASEGSGGMPRKSNWDSHSPFYLEVWLLEDFPDRTKT